MNSLRYVAYVIITNQCIIDKNGLSPSPLSPSPPVLNSLQATYQQALQRDDVKAIVVTGKVFIAYYYL